MNTINNFISGGLEYQSHVFTEGGTLIFHSAKDAQVLVVANGEIVYDKSFALESDSYYDIAVGTYGELTSSFTKSDWLDPSSIVLTARPTSYSTNLELTLEDGTPRIYGNQPIVIVTYAL